MDYMDGRSQYQSRGPRQYKSRRDRPCDFCRVRKVACRIDVSPPCALCRSQGTACTFVEQPTKRKRARVQDRDDGNAGDSHQLSPLQLLDGEGTSLFISLDDQLDASIGTHEDQSPGKSSFHASSTSPVALTTGLTRWSSTTSSSTKSATSVTSNSMQASPQKDGGRFRREAQPFESALESRSNMSARIAGDTSESNRYLLRYYSYDDKDECVLPHMTYRRMKRETDSTSNQGHGSEDGQDPPIVFMQADDNLAETGEPRVEPNALENARAEVAAMFSDEQSVRLVRLFFRYVYPYFPILSRSWFFSTDVPFVSKIRSLPLSLLSSLYATALPFMLHDDHLVTTLAHSSPSRNDLYRICWMAINHELHAPRLATLQACLLLNQRGPTNQYLTATPFKASLMGWTVGLAHSLGLPHDCSLWTGLPLWERRVRIRVWWAVFVMDHWISLGSGTPYLINSADFDVPQLKRPPSSTSLSLNPSSSDATETPIGAAHFYHLVNLTLILSDIQENYFTIRAAKHTSHNLSRSLELARPLRGRLTEWKRAFAIDCPLQTPLNPTSRTSHAPLNGNASLDLACLVATVTLFRALLRPIESSSPSSPLSNDIVDTTEDFGARAAIHAGAMTCSREAVELLEKLISIGSVWNAFWHSWSQSNFAVVSTFLMHMLLLRGGGTRAFAPDRNHGSTLSSANGRGAKEKDTITETGDLVRRWRWAMRSGAGSGGWGNSLMSLGLLRVDGLMVSLEGRGQDGDCDYDGEEQDGRGDGG